MALTNEQRLKLAGYSPDQVEQINTQSKSKKGLTEWIQPAMATIGGASAIPYKGGPLAAFTSSAAGFALKDIVTPKPSSHYTGETGALGLPKLSEEGRQAKLQSVKDMLTSSAKSAVLFDLIQGLFGPQGSISGKATRPKQTTMEYRNQQAKLNPGEGVPKGDVITKILDKTENLKLRTGYLKPVEKFQKELPQKYEKVPNLLSTSDLLNLKAPANTGGYTKGGTLKSNAAGAFDQKTGDVLRGLIANNSKAVAVADKIYSTLSKIPKTVGKAGSAAIKIGATVGILRLLLGK